MDTGHWVFNVDFDVDEWFGFVYRITEHSTSRSYIGKKQFHEYRRKSVAGRKNKIRTKKESDWKTYTGSSKELNEAIMTNGKDNYSFFIESLHKTRASLTYAEIQKQITEDVLRKKDENGNRIYFNKQIGSVKFLPPDEHSDETKIRISNSLCERYKTNPHWRSSVTDEEKQLLNEMYYSGKNHYLYRILSDEEREEFISKNLIGENNPSFGKIPHIKGKTYEEFYGSEKAKEIKSILSEKCGKSGEENGMFGKTHSIKTKEKWGQNDNRRHLGEDNGMFGKPCYYNMTEEKISEWKSNISKSTKGIPKSKEHAAKIGKAHKGKQKAEMTCPVCGLTGRGGNMKRYHFENCKKNA